MVGRWAPDPGVRSQQQTRPRALDETGLLGRALRGGGICLHATAEAAGVSEQGPRGQRKACARGEEVDGES